MCLALWTCAAVAGPAVQTLSVYVLYAPAAPFAVCIGTPLFRHALFSGARRRGRVLQQPGPWCLHPLQACSAGCARYHCMQGVAYRTPGMQQNTGVRWVHRLPTNTPRRWFTCRFPLSRLCWHDPGVLSDARRRGCVLRQPGPLCLHPLHACSAGYQTKGAAMMPGKSRRYWRHPRARMLFFPDANTG